MNRCRLCVIPDTRPDTPFVEGICSACRSFAKRRAIDWKARAMYFHELMARYEPGDNTAYDCVVASSGGKDSHWQVLKVIEEGYRPLVVTASTCYLTPIGRANIDNLARYADTIEVTNNRAVRAKLNRLGMELVGDISWPEHAGIFTTPWAVAAAMHIPIVLYGENPQEAYGGPEGTETAARMTRRWVTEFGGFLGLRAEDLASQDGLTTLDLHPYYPISEEQAAAAHVEAHFLGAYFEWDSERNAKVALEHGMLQEKPSPANWWTHENLDNAMTGLHDHAMFRKYGYGRGAAQVSVDVRNGRATREQAMAFVREHDGEPPYIYAGVRLDQVLERLGRDEEWLWGNMGKFTNKDLFVDAPVGGTDWPLLKEFA